MNCRNARECSQAKGRVMEAEPWNFPDPSPQVEATNAVWHFVGFVLIVGVMAAAVLLLVLFI